MIMISLFEISVAVFVISSAITFIIMMKEMMSLKRKISSATYSETISLKRRIDELSREIESLKFQIRDIKISIPAGSPKPIERNIKQEEMDKINRATTVRNKTIKETALSAIELEVLRALLREGELSSSDLKEILGRSREHLSRVLKSLYEKGLVERVENVKPYRYRIKEEGKEVLNIP